MARRATQDESIGGTVADLRHQLKQQRVALDELRAGQATLHQTIGELRQLLGDVLHREPSTDALLTVAQAAELLSMSAKYVYRAVADGRLRSIKVGSRVRIQPEDVKTFLRRRRA